jgi:hypothetical protein
VGVTSIVGISVGVQEGVGVDSIGVKDSVGVGVQEASSAHALPENTIIKSIAKRMIDIVNNELKIK